MEIITVLIINIIRSSTHQNQSSSLLDPTMETDHPENGEINEPSAEPSGDAQPTYKLAEKAANSIPSVRNIVFGPDNDSSALKPNLNGRNIAPTNITLNEKTKDTVFKSLGGTGNDRLEIMDKEIKGQTPVLNELGRTNSNQSTSLIQFQNPKPPNDIFYESLLNMEGNTSPYNSDNFSRGGPGSVYEPELYMNTSRKLSQGESQKSPSLVTPVNLLETRTASPVLSNHSGGFKLHPSRKNSDLDDLGNEMRLGRLKSFEEPTTG